MRRQEMSVIIGRTLDYLPFFLVAAVGVGLLVGETEGSAGLAILTVPLVLSLLLAAVEWYRRE
ncbi:hypothetical protein RYH80_13140 [Halobaculum sp. MBLA0147]|uniref:hypothetical protein n=1 Tax=Halobaculum sp. MBLA0147 TaxID=3079934 RepID=UPI003525C55C